MVFYLCVPALMRWWGGRAEKKIYLTSSGGKGLKKFLRKKN